MICENCGIKITCKTDVCPVCHSPVSGGENFPLAFPKAKKPRSLRDIPFTVVYLSISIVILIIMGILTAILPLNISYLFITAGGLLYLYYWIRITILSYRHLNMKVFGQTAAMTAIGILIESTLEINLHVFELILPIIYIVAILVVFINIMVNTDNARSYLVSFLSIVILGFAPLIAYFFELFLLWPAILVASVSALTIILLIIITRKSLKDEFSRIFHR